MTRLLTAGRALTRPFGRKSRTAAKQAPGYSNLPVDVVRHYRQLPLSRAL